MSEGQFMDEKVRTLLELADLMECHYPWPVPPGLFHFSSLKEFLLGSLASLGQSELPSSWLLPTWHRWPGLCSHLSQLSGGWQLQWPPNLLQLLILCPPSLYLSWHWSGLHIRYWRFCQCWGFHRCSMHLHPSFCLQGLPALPHLGHLFILAILELKENWPIRSQSSLMRITWYLFQTGYCAFSKISIWFQLFFLLHFFVCYNVKRVE